MKRSSGARKTANLSESVHHQLNMYALAASAVGVTLLALAQPVEAKIVYTPIHKQLPINKNWLLDLNHDGVVDFVFRDAYGQTVFTTVGSLSVTPNFANNVWGTVCSGAVRVASALPAGVRVGPKGKFSDGQRRMAWYSSANGARNFAASCGHGPWAGAARRYLGLKFAIKGKTHFGWARFNVSVSGLKVIATVTGYAYETIPNKPIITGKIKTQDEIGGSIEQPNTASLNAPTLQPAGLGLLAMGTPGLSIWRRK